MKKILIFGYFGFQNFGDEWLLKVLIKLLTQYGDKNKEIAVLYNTTTQIRENGVLFVPRWNIVEIIKSIFVADTVISCGGLFQDETSIYSIFYYTFILLFAKIFGKKVVLISTEFVVKRLPFFIIKMLVCLADYVLTRSYVDVEIFKNKDKLEYCPDICLYEYNFDVMFSFFEKKSVGLIVNNKEDFVLLKEICSKLAKDYKIVFVPFHLKEDYEISLKLSEVIKNCEIRVWDDVKNFRNIFKDINFIITSRLHGIIVSIVLNIPFVCISKNEKIRRVMKTLLSVEPLGLESLKKESYRIENFKVELKPEKILENKKIIIEKFIKLADGDFI